MRTLTLAAAAAFVCCASSAAADDPPQRTISVAGTAAVTAANDTSGFTTGVTVRRSSAAAALRAASARMQRVLSALDAAGIARRDVRTQRVDVTRTRRRHTVGYDAISTVFVTVRAVQRTGSVVDAAVRAGANRLAGLRFWRSGTKDLYQQALIAALRKARAKAQALATEAGATLGAVQTISEGGVQSFSYDSSAGSVAAPAPVRPGRSKITADVAVVYLLE